MSEQRWTIRSAENFAYTPAEIAQIGRAAQAFLDVMRTVGGPNAFHLVSLEVGVLNPAVAVAHPQPDEFDVKPWTGVADPPPWLSDRGGGSSPAAADEP